METKEVRFSLTVADLDKALTLFRDTFGLEVSESFDVEAGRGVILKVPEATFELLDVGHAHMVDEIEVGRWLGERWRIALKVGDLSEAALAVTDAGATEMALAVETPWGDRNQRFKTSEGVQLTLFQG